MQTFVQKDDKLYTQNYVLTAQSKTILADSMAVLKAVASKHPLPTWKLEEKIHTNDAN